MVWHACRTSFSRLAAMLSAAFCCQGCLPPTGIIDRIASFVSSYPPGVWVAPSAYGARNNMPAAVAVTNAQQQQQSSETIFSHLVPLRGCSVEGLAGPFELICSEGSCPSENGGHKAVRRRCYNSQALWNVSTAKAETGQGQIPDLGRNGQQIHQRYHTGRGRILLQWCHRSKWGRCVGRGLQRL